MVFHTVGKMNSIYLFQRLISPNCLIRNFSRAPSLLYCSSKDSGDDESKKDGDKRGKFAKFFQDFNVDNSPESSEVESKSTIKFEESKTLDLKTDLPSKNQAETNLEYKHETDWRPDDEVVNVETQFKSGIEDESRVVELELDPFNRKDKQISDEDKSKLGAFALAFDKFSKIGTGPEQEPEQEDKPEPEEEQQTFAALLKNSKFMDLGDPKGKVVLGNVYHVVGNDLYIDFGWKFPTVCPRPAKGGENYKRGTKVRLLIKDLELSTKFLGSTTDTTLNEADCVLLGLAQKR